MKLPKEIHEIFNRPYHSNANTPKSSNTKGPLRVGLVVGIISTALIADYGEDQRSTLSLLLLSIYLSMFA